jgi:glycosyltransferase involved in cell wall biosynthesis
VEEIDLRVVALLAVRNEEVYIGRCLEHLWRQGVETCVIDNESTDSTVEIAESFYGRGVFRVERFPYPGHYDWVGLLTRKEALAREIEADWFIHHDADEIREAPAPFATLKDGLIAADAAGATAVNFDEFVFVPLDHEDFVGVDYLAAMRRYYYFSPQRLHRINAWKNLGEPIDLVCYGGHVVEFSRRVVYDRNFVLRHYIFLSKAHAVEKYGGRTYSTHEVQVRVWHGWRPYFRESWLRLPNAAELETVDERGSWCTSRPFQQHPFIRTD